MMKGNKKYVVFTNSGFPFGGASANFLRLISQGLSNLGEETQIIIQRGNSYDDSPRESLADSIKYKYILFSKRPSNIFLKIVDSLAGISYPPLFLLFKSKNTIKNIIVYNNSAIEVIPLLIVSKLKGIPCTSIVVEWYEKKTLTMGNIFRSYKWIDFIVRMRYLNKHFSSLIVLSRFLFNYYVDNGFSASEILLIPNLVDANIFEINKCDKEVETNKNKFVIGYCGSPYRKDGILDLLKAFELFSRGKENVELKVIGDMPGKSALPELKKIALNYEISNKTCFTGLVPFVEVPRLLNSCDVLVLARPSGVFAEAGFPTKLGEYFASKKAVVVTAVGDIPFYFRNGKEVLLASPDNPQSISHCFEELYQNIELREQLSKRGNEWAKKNLDYNINARKILEFLDGN